MNNEQIEELTTRLQDLRVQRILAEETQEEIPQESTQVKYRLMVARSANMRDRQDGTALARPQNNTKTFKIGYLVRSTNTYCPQEFGGHGNIILVGSFYIRLKNSKIGTIYKRHWRSLKSVTAKVSQ